MGREFDHLFDAWANHYDYTITGADEQYAEVFMNYEKILLEVSSRVKGTILEFGVGTGNLTKLLLADENNEVIGIEPSRQMRNKAKEKLPSLTLLDGDFLHFAIPHTEVDALVSTYAFHHLTDSEKEQAISLYSSLLSSGGKVVFADTVFLSLEDKENCIAAALEKGYDRLAEDLLTEHYTTIPYLQSILKKYNFDVSFEALNRYVWMMVAIKKPA